jgi:hypothetical protein
MTITLPNASSSQCSCAWGAEADGLAPQITTQRASRIVLGSKPSTDVP